VTDEVSAPHSYSGIHPFDASHLTGCSPELVRTHVAAIAAGRCPRCSEPFTRPPTARNIPPPWADQPKEAALMVGRPGIDFPWYPAGSKVTFCRCIPICDWCGRAERLSTVAPRHWPLAERRIRQERAALEKQLRGSHAEQVTAADLDLSGHSGGWADPDALDPS
jgi:hypothetical protein